MEFHEVELAERVSSIWTRYCHGIYDGKQGLMVYVLTRTAKPITMKCDMPSYDDDCYVQRMTAMNHAI